MKETEAKRVEPEASCARSDRALAGLCREVGCVVTTFNWMEAEVSVLIAKVLRLPEVESYAGVFHAAMSFRQKVDLLVALYKTRFSDANKTKALETFAKALLAMEQKRNQAAHMTLRPDSSQLGWVKHKSSVKGAKGLRKQIERLSENQILRGWAQEAIGAFNEFNSLSEWLSEANESASDADSLEAKVREARMEFPS